MALDYTILAPSVVTKIVSRIAVPGNTIQRFLGFEPGGRNVEQLAPDGVRQYTYDIFDNVRSIAQGRAPGTGPGTVTRNPVGANTVTIARSYEKIPDMVYEFLSNIRQIGSNAGVLDRRGVKYLELQGRFLQQRQVNFREFLSWGVLRGTVGFTISGDTWTPVLTGGTISLDWKIPTGNKSQLNMLGAGDILGTSWANAAADIPADLDEISAAFQQLVGAPLDWVMTDSVVINHIMNNTAMKAQAGTANVVYDEKYMPTGEKSDDGRETGLRYLTFKARPWIRFFVTDAGLDVNGTFTKFFSGGEAAFGVDLGLGFLKMQEGSELVKESPWGAPDYKRGHHAWIREWDEPARVELHSINNIVPELTIPKGLAFGDVVF
jgi:hypothetical protein